MLARLIDSQNVLQTSASAFQNNEENPRRSRYGLFNHVPFGDVEFNGYAATRKTTKPESKLFRISCNHAQEREGDKGINSGYILKVKK